jgi:Domain of unknown function (DUF4252)
MVFRAVVASIALLSSSALMAAESTRLKLPDFSHLHAKAVESVDISVSPFMLWFATQFAPERDEDGTEVKKILQGIKAVYIRSFQFAEDNVYSKADIDSVREQLRDQQWQPLAQIQSHKKQENVDIFIAIENDKATGFAILASEPREFTIVNVVGTIDPQHIGKLQANLNLRDGGGRRFTIND